MKNAVVLHNPGAGEGEFSRKQLISEVESAGFNCSYSSTKQFRWQDLDTQSVDFLILAGGDGTVRKIVQEMLSQKMIEKKFPLAVLPFGTANNIAKTLGLSGTHSEIINGWRNPRTKVFDAGVIDGLSKPTFFLESFGYGLFPKLMKEMLEEGRDKIENPKESILVALKVLHDLILKASAKKCQLRIDDTDYSGEFLLIEVMNIQSIGPNLGLAPDADPGDGQFEVVLITEKQRSHLAEYVSQKLKGNEIVFDFPLLKARQIEMFWDGKHAHVDDEYRKVDEPTTIRIENRSGLLEFILPYNAEG